MLNRTLLRSVVSAAALTICTAPAYSSAFAADLPTGRYEAKDLRLFFDETGLFHVTKGEITEVSGTYTVQGGRIELTDVKGPWACTNPGQQTGTYNWKFDGATLTFSKISDSCDDRSASLVPAAWKRQK